VDVRVQSTVRKADEPPIKVQGTAPTDVAISDAALPSAPPGTRIVTIIDGMSGRRQNVVVPEFVEQNAAPEDRSTDRWSPDRSRQNPLLKAATDGPRAAKSTSAKQVIP